MNNEIKKRNQSPKNTIYHEINNQASVHTVFDAYGLQSDSKSKYLCPFHDDSRPSLSVKDDRIWRCFACGESGNAISFVYKYENKILGHAITWPEAAQKVVEICGLDISIEILRQNENTPSKKTHGRHIYTAEELSNLALFQRVHEMTRYTLSQKEGNIALNYLLDRGLDEKTIHDLSLGYIPKERMEQWIDSETFDRSKLEAIGLARFDENKQIYRPVFWDRVLIPICDQNGHVVAYGGRSINGQEPKYLINRTTDIFKKSQHLYNFHNAKKTAYENNIYLVEGFFDVAGGMKIGIQNIVALMGTAISEEQCDLLKSLDCSITLMLDNDAAGRDAMIKAIPNLIGRGFRVNVVSLGEVAQSLSLNTSIDQKDLFDLSKAGATKEAIEKNTKGAFEFLLTYKYFAGKGVTPDTILDIYKVCQKDGMLREGKNQIVFNDYVQSHSHYTREDIQKIIGSIMVKDQKPSSKLEAFQINLMKQYIHSSIRSYLVQKNNPNFMKQYKIDTKAFYTKVYETFIRNPERYLDTHLSSIDIKQLMEATFQNDKSLKRSPPQTQKNSPRVYTTLEIPKTYIQKATDSYYFMRLPKTIEEPEKKVYMYFDVRDVKNTPKNDTLLVRFAHHREYQIYNFYREKLEKRSTLAILKNWSGVARNVSDKPSKESQSKTNPRLPTTNFPHPSNHKTSIDVPM